MGTIDSWSSIETIIRQRLDLNEIDRRYCAVCGRQGPTLSRCFGCQMVYYCGEEHQAEDWSEEHAEKCAQLEWVALGEFIQALPAQPPLPNLGDKWSSSLKEIHNWKNWFSIRTNIVQLANNTANIFKKLVHATDKRQPSHQNAVDGLLAAVTDLLTHVLTIGKAVVYFGLRPNIRPLTIHILNGFNKIDLIGNDQSSSNLPIRFHELLNMFPDNKGVELVIVIGDDDQDDTDQSSVPHAKLKPDRLIITTTGKGRFLDTSEERRLRRSEADLLVYFNAWYLFTLSNKELLKSMLMKQRPTLLTFEDEEEFNEAKTCLSSKGVNIHQAGINQFSSLIVRQRSNRPNSVYSTNSYQILLNTMPVNGTGERNDENCSLLSRQRPHQSSIGVQHGHTQVQHQQQLNPGLKQVNVSTTNTTEATITTTVQPLIRASNNNNNIRQPTIVQRRQHSSPALASSSAVITANAYREARPTTTIMMTAVEPNRNEHKPQPKPRLSLVKTTNKDIESIPSQVNGNIVQRIKPVFEQSLVIPSQESKPIKQQQQQQQRQPVSIPYTYQTGNTTKATCLDDIIPSKKMYIPSPPSPLAEIHINERTNEIISSPSSVELRHEQRALPIPTNNISQIPKPIIEHHTDKRLIKTIPNSTSSPSIVPIEIHHDQRTVMSAPMIVPPRPTSSSISSIENRSDEKLTITAATTNISTTRVQLNETHIEQSTVTPATTSTKSSSPPPIPPLPSSSTNSSTTRIQLNKTHIEQSTVTPATTSTKSSSPSPPPVPPPPPSSSANNEVIYTEVIKHHERPLPLHHIDLSKTTLSPSRSFIIPTKAPSLLSKTPSYSFQRSSQLSTATNYSSQTNKSKPVSSMMTSDRISLYSQRSTKQPDVGVTIKNLSECIDRVGIVFDETHRPHDAPSVGLTTVDLIREQLTTSSTTKPTGSLLDKLYKSNSSTRLSTPSSRPPLTIASPRSKSQQAPRINDEKSSIPKPTTPTTPPSIRRPVGVFLPLTTKNTQEPEQTTAIIPEQSPALVYQNLESHHTSTIDSISPPSQTLDYTLKQPTGPLCNGIPKPFRKPTAIIEPSPVVALPIAKIPEPNYINLTHQDDQHIYTNENGTAFTGGSSSSNSYTSKTSSVYSSTDKQNQPTNIEPHYAVTNIPISLQQEQQSVDYDSFDDDVVVEDMAHIEKPINSNDNTDDDSFDDDDNQNPLQTIPSKNASTNFFRSTLNRLTRSNKSLERLNTEPTANDLIQESNPSNIIDTKTKKTLRSIKARHEAKKTGNLFVTYTGDDDTTSIDSNCSTQTATSLNKTNKTSHHRFRLFRRKVEKDFASDTEAEKQQTEQRRKKWNKKILTDTANELKTKRLLMMSDDDDEEHNLNLKINDETHIYDHIIHDEIINNTSRMGKLSNETHFKAPTVTLDEIRSEIQAEIAARQDIQINNQSITSSNLTLQKKRSKSVTFLDELLSDNSKEKQTNRIVKNDLQIKQSTTIKRIEKGDARSICGALTGTGPIRGIIKAANNDITGTTAPVSPSAAAAIYLSGPTNDTRCTSPKAHERTHRPLSTYTVGSARFYDGGSLPTNSTPSSSSATAPPAHSLIQNNNNNNNNVSNQRPILNNTSQHSTSENVHHKRPTAKVSPFQTKSPHDPLSSSPTSTKQQQQQQQIISSSTTKKPIRPSLNRNMQTSHDITNIATPSVSEGVGGVSKRLQSNF
ncbi:unnamed protein product [Adineta steineri]|uniref:MYND-type domain-containing protein n=1 Tax=Adineta steineri TaxID=433720 RepID=A0A818Q4Y0_9BILA|nr:unnamed protein product [Adineta steineri]CAF3635850.1 unnamed protein product [Adineta steineri]